MTSLWLGFKSLLQTIAHQIKSHFNNCQFFLGLLLEYRTLKMGPNVTANFAAVSQVFLIFWAFSYVSCDNIFQGDSREM